MTTLAYIRVSTQLQTGESQKYEIEKFCKTKNINVGKWIEESVSGTIPWENRRLGKAVRKLGRGDLIICTELSRLGRNMLMIMSLLNYCSSKGISIHTIKDNFDLSDNINSKIIAKSVIIIPPLGYTYGRTVHSSQVLLLLLLFSDFLFLFLSFCFLLFLFHNTLFHYQIRLHVL